MSREPAGNKLLLTTTSAFGGRLLKLSGVIDERFDRAELSRALAGVVVIDLDEVTRITSFGVREWVGAVQGAAPRYLGFVRCRPTLVSQFNMVSGFAGRGELLSFYAPYQCGACGKDFEVLLDVRKNHAAFHAYTVPNQDCPDCNQKAELDDMPETYLSFVTGAALPAPPPEVEAWLDGRSAPSRALRVDKQVDLTITGLWLSGPLDAAARFKRLGDGLEGDVVLIPRFSMLEPEGIQLFLKFLRDCPVTLFLAQAALPLLAAMGADFFSEGRVKLLSVLAPAECVLGHQRTWELTSASESAFPLKAPFPCGTCGGEMTAQLTAVEEAQLGQLPFVEPPAEVAAFLAAHRYGPTRPDPTKKGGGKSGLVMDKYRVLRELGSGGMAQVYLAIQTGVGGFSKQVVLKRILPRLTTQEAFVQMFLDEARIAARVNHPNVVQIYDIGKDGDLYFIAMEHISGSDLAVLLKLSKRLGVEVPWPVALKIMADVCAGLYAAHTCVDSDGVPYGIIHRDVSPHNVLVSRAGLVKLSDFGIAKAADTQKVESDSSVRGKVAYLAPELVSNKGVIDHRVDLFSAGLMLYECLTLERPFQRKDSRSTLHALVHDPAPDIRTLRPEVPEAVQSIIERALAKSAEERYPDAQELQLGLEAVMSSQSKAVTPADVSAWFSRVWDGGVSAGFLQEPTRNVDTSTPFEFADPRDDEVTPSMRTTTVK